MDRVFMHLQYVRCPTCSRVFCCTKHRVAHERRVHVAVPGGPVIKRRFRSALRELQQPGKQQTVPSGAHSVINGRKRLHAATTANAAQSIGSGLRMMEKRQRQGEELRRAEELHRAVELRRAEELRRIEQLRRDNEQRAAMRETCARSILKARRSGLSTIRHLRPVAESSPAVPPIPSTPHVTSIGAAAFQPNESAVTPTDWSVVVSSVGSPPSFYQTPMQTPLQKLPDTPMQKLPDMPMQKLPDTPMQKLPDTPLQTLSDTPLQKLPDKPLETLSDTPVNGKPRYRNVKRVSSSIESTPKGFFWSNMARRFRLALRPTKSKVSEVGFGPSPSAENVDMVNPYCNIQPRRPICINDTLTTPVHPRPTLDAIRKAHEEASKAFNKLMSD